jgi:beta-glucosidase
MPFCAVLLLLVACTTREKTEFSENKKNPSMEIDKRVSQLLSSMSLEEKVGQMTQVTIDLILKDDSNTEIDEKKLREAIIERKVGSILNIKGNAYSLEKWHEIIRRVQEVATKETPRGIPIVYGIDAIHGQNYTQGATLFPHNIGMAASRNDELAAKAARITAMECRASGIPWNFDPVLGLGRQPLWGRFEETYGEDVYLAGNMGAAVIEAYQGDSLSSPISVAACMKHFLGYSVPHSGKDRTPAYIPETQLRELFVPPFQRAVDAGVATVMVNSGEINGIPVHGSPFYLTRLLREEMGFTGLTVSDWEDVKRLYTRHRVAKNPKEAVKIAVNSGIDMSMVPYDYSFADYLKELVEEGEVLMSRIDEAVARILRVKFALGLFEKPFSYEEALENFGKPAYKKVALQAALESMTLLKNETVNGRPVLPLPKGVKVLLAGPAAHSRTALHGSWTYVWQGDNEEQYPDETMTIKEAMEQRIGKNKLICSSVREYGSAENVNIDQLKKDAKQADVIILAMGEDAYAESPGLLNDLMLDRDQLALAKAAIDTGKPVILVLAEGRPRIIEPIEGGCPGILLAYRPGSRGAEAIAQVLFGDYNPGGALPFTYPRYTGDLLTYDHKFSETIRETAPGVFDNEGYNPQFPFGHGLSYTTFVCSGLKLSRSKLREGEELEVRVSLKNTGSRAGSKVVDLFARDLFASVTPPMRKLRRYARVFLAPGESKEVVFSLTTDDLSFINAEGKRVCEPGAFELMVADLEAGFEVE